MVTPSVVVTVRPVAFSVSSTVGMTLLSWTASVRGTTFLSCFLTSSRRSGVLGEEQLDGLVALFLVAAVAGGCEVADDGGSAFGFGYYVVEFEFPLFSIGSAAVAALPVVPLEDVLAELPVVEGAVLVFGP